jgi:hypothetical protein
MRGVMDEVSEPFFLKNAENKMSRIRYLLALFPRWYFGEVNKIGSITMLIKDIQEVLIKDALEGKKQIRH